MRNRTAKSAVLLPLFLSLLLIPFAGAAEKDEPEQRPAKRLVVIANRATPLNKVSTSQLQELLLGTVSKWPNGREVSVIFVANHSMVRALKQVLKMSKDDYANHFLKSQYQNVELNKPKTVPNLDSALQFLTSTPGSVAILEADPDMTVGGVKTVRVDGKLPEEEGYRY